MTRTRFLLLGMPIVAGMVLVLVLLRAEPKPGATYRVDAIFDTAKGVIPGQLVKVAGARAGEVEDVTLTPDYKARIHMSVDRRFAPFRSDARCSIQPEGLISENFVQCEPGTPDGRPLRGRDDQAPTVPVANTSVPVNLTDLFNIFRTPVRQRLSLVVATLGIGTAARGEELNDVIRRANPTLALVRRALTTVNRQRSQLAATVTATDRIVAELARRPQEIRLLIERAERVSAVTADRRRNLGRGIRRLPPLLDEVRPAAARLERLAADSAPVLANLRAAAPDLQRLVIGLEPFAQAGLPALAPLRSAADQGRRTIEETEDEVDLLRRLADDIRPVGAMLRELLLDLRGQGGVESLLSFGYYATAATARFDSASHILPTNVINNACSQFATEPVEGCNTFYRGGDTTIDPAGPSQPLLPAELVRGRERSDGRRGAARRKGARRQPGARERSPRDAAGSRHDQALARRAVRGTAPADDGSSQALLDFLLG